MADDITQLTADDFEEAMDFLNLAFSEHGPIDFAEMLPSIYRPTDRHMANNYAIKRDGRICAVVGLFPTTWHVGDAALRVGGIGGVSAHPDLRGSGLMTALMEHCVKLMKAQKYPLSWLGGQRQRYLYFGYERCGNTSVFTVNKKNLKHCFEGDLDIRFEAIGPEDRERIARAKALHDAQPMYCQRLLEDFHIYCTSRSFGLFAALDGSGRMVGYLAANEKSDYVAELGAEGDDIVLEMLQAWVAHHSEQSATIDIAPIACNLIHRLGRICESTSVKSSGNWQVIDWAAVTDALMKMRRLSGPMADGAVVVGIKDYGAIRLQADRDEAGCAAADEDPDVSCDAPTAMRLLFGPLPPSLVMPLPEVAAPLESWYPLPLTWKRQDGV